MTGIVGSYIHPTDGPNVSHQRWLVIGYALDNQERFVFLARFCGEMQTAFQRDTVLCIAGDPKPSSTCPWCDPDPADSLINQLQTLGEKS